MGCDIHVYFEVQQDDGSWACSPKPRPDPNWWWERIADHAVDTGGAHILLGRADSNQDAYDHVVDYLKSLSPEQVMEKFGTNPRIVWDWGLSYDIRARNYHWFGLLAGVRVDTCLFGEPRGRAPGMSPEVEIECQQWEGDAHSHSWLMIHEILEQPKLEDYPNTKWIKQQVEAGAFDPLRSRMVFWFDN